MKVRNHKIYNEVISKFNDVTGKWETISEDSLNYSGELHLASMHENQAPFGIPTTNVCAEIISPNIELTCDSPNYPLPTDDYFSPSTWVNGYDYIPAVGGYCSLGGLSGYPAASETAWPGVGPAFCEETTESPITFFVSNPDDAFNQTWVSGAYTCCIPLATTRIQINNTEQVRIFSISNGGTMDNQNFENGITTTYPNGSSNDWINNNPLPELEEFIFPVDAGYNPAVPTAGGHHLFDPMGNENIATKLITDRIGKATDDNPFVDGLRMLRKADLGGWGIYFFRVSCGNSGTTFGDFNNESVTDGFGYGCSTSPLGLDSGVGSYFNDYGLTDENGNELCYDEYSVGPCYQDINNDGFLENIEPQDTNASCNPQCSDLGDGWTFIEGTPEASDYEIPGCTTPSAESVIGMPTLTHCNFHEPSDPNQYALWYSEAVLGNVFNMYEANIDDGSCISKVQLCYDDSDGDGQGDESIPCALTCAERTAPNGTVKAEDVCPDGCVSITSEGHEFDEFIDIPGAPNYGCTDVNACNPTVLDFVATDYSDGTWLDDGSCEYESCCTNQGQFNGTTCECYTKDETNTSGTIMSHDYCGEACEFEIDDCNDCVNLVGEIDPLTAGFVAVPNQNMDDCNLCGGDAVRGNAGIGAYPSENYTNCYQPEGSTDFDDNFVTSGPGYEDGLGFFTCSSFSLNWHYGSELLFDSPGPYGIGNPVSSQGNQDGVPINCVWYGLGNSVSYDVGCADSNACNYVFDAEDCEGELNGGDTGCCIYPQTYCYAVSAEAGYDLDGAGSDDCCNVDNTGTIVLSELYCDGEDTSATGAINGYTGASDSDYIANGGTVVWAAAATLVSTGNALESNGSDTTLGLNESCGQYTPVGCPDPVAINYADEIPALFSESTQGSIYNEIPVTTCQYCNEGQIFYWSDTYADSNVTIDTDSVAYDNVEAGANGYNSYNEFKNASLYINDDTNGACFSQNDLGVLDIWNNSRGINNPGRPVNMNQNIGRQWWDGGGRLHWFEAVNTGAPQQNLGLTSIGGVGSLSNLSHLNVSNNNIIGDVPAEIGNLTFLQNLYLHDNNFSGFETSDVDICNLAATLGLPGGEPGDIINPEPDYSVTDSWLYVMGNNMCPTTINQLDAQYGYTFYPVCLTGVDGPNSVYVDLGWNQSNFGISFNEQFQTNLDENVQDTSNCALAGCLYEQAVNFWPEATADCNGVVGGTSDFCCQFDGFLHFPFANGSFGGGMSTYQMIQALHANIYGLSYTYFGSLDVTAGVTTWDYSAPITDESECYDDIVSNCQPNFNNDEPEGNTDINIEDGLWLRKYSIPNEECTSTSTASDNISPCLGDARPLEFLLRIQSLIESGADINAYANYILTYFQTFGTDISMLGINYFEDYDVNDDGQFDLDDISYWESIGRIDIVNSINAYGAGELFLENEPQFQEYWAPDAEVAVGQYFKSFDQEEIASGQYECSNEGDSSTCYTDIYSCGLVNENYLLMLGIDCSPCGISNTSPAGGYCIPKTISTAKPGNHKIIKNNLKKVPYFTDGNSSILKGSNIHTSSISDTNKKYYYGATDGDPDSSSSDTQFFVTWGHKIGSGSITDGGNIKGASEAIYKQYASTLLEPLEIEKGFLISSGSDVVQGDIDGNPDNWIYVVNFKQSRFQDAIEAGTWTLELSGSTASNSGSSIRLTDNSKLLADSQKIINNAGRRFDIISGSNGTAYPDYSVIGQRYGYFYPDAGLMVFGEKLSNEFKSVTTPQITEFNGSYDTQLTGFITASNGSNQISGSGTLFTTELAVGDDLRILSGSISQRFSVLNISSSTSMSVSTNWANLEYTQSLGFKNSGHNQLYPLLSSNEDSKNALRFVNLLKNVNGNALTLFGEKDVLSTTYICDINNNDFNHTNNFTILSSSGINPFSTDIGIRNGFNTSTISNAFTGSAGQVSSPITGDSQNMTINDALGDAVVWPGSNVSTTDGNQTTFITQIHLYDNYGRQVAIASLSKPLLKNFDYEAVIKVKLEF